MASAASMAAAKISARSTMPGPPPAGVSSTLRWRSVAESLISRASSDQTPEASALPARLTPSGPGNISGNRVRTVARHSEVMALLRALVWRNQYAAPLESTRRQSRVPSARMMPMAWMERRFLTELLLAAVINELQGLIAPQILLDLGHDGAFDPVIDRRRVPSLKHHLVLLGHVLGVLDRKAGFDPKGVDRAGLGGYRFLSDN